MIKSEGMVERLGEVRKGSRERIEKGSRAAACLTKFIQSGHSVKIFQGFITQTHMHLITNLHSSTPIYTPKAIDTPVTISASAMDSPVIFPCCSLDVCISSNV